MNENVIDSLIQDDPNYLEIKKHESYLKLFPPEIRYEAVKQILDIRKFEIELYWKRSTYYWTLSAAIFAGYFSTYASFKNEPNKLIILFFLNCLGILFAIGWYFVNRGSKFWQVNWEKHLHSLESSVIGPLYKTTISAKYYFSKFLDPVAPFPFSVSKINQILNLVVIIFWFLLLLFLRVTYLRWDFSLAGLFSFYSIFTLFTFLGIFCLFACTHTGKDWSWHTPKRDNTFVNFEKRRIREGTEQGKDSLIERRGAMGKDGLSE